jgi:cell wall-associated NlpC family hydrolase
MERSYVVSFSAELRRHIGVPYLYGGRDKRGIDCSSLIIASFRNVLGISIDALPWMTAHQMATGVASFTKSANPNLGSHDEVKLGFFDWSGGSDYEHVICSLQTGEWVWASSTAGSVICVAPGAITPWRRQWLEISQAISRSSVLWRSINWAAFSREES